METGSEKCIVRLLPLCKRQCVLTKTMTAVSLNDIIIWDHHIGVTVGQNVIRGTLLYMGKYPFSPSSLSILLSLPIWPVKNYIPQPPLHLGMTMWLSSSQEDTSRIVMCGIQETSLREENTSFALFVLSPSWMRLNLDYHIGSWGDVQW